MASVVGCLVDEKPALLQRPPPGVEARLAELVTLTKGPDAEFGLLPETEEIEPMTLFLGIQMLSHGRYPPFHGSELTTACKVCSPYAYILQGVLAGADQDRQANLGSSVVFAGKVPELNQTASIVPSKTSGGPVRQAEQTASPLPPEVIIAWKKAGASIGWMDRQYGWFHTGWFHTEEGKPGEVPAFRFTKLDPKALRQLPRPDRAFGLCLSYTRVSDADLQGLADLKFLQVLEVGESVTNEGLKELAGLKSLQTLARAPKASDCRWFQ